MILAKRVQNISPSATLVIADKARKMKMEGIDVISFATGEPDFPTPEIIKEEGIKWIRKDFTKYVASNGIPELKEAICKKFERENGLVYTPDEILVGNGAKQLIFQACGALIDPGDEVIIPTPCWVSYIEQVKLFGGVPVLVDTSEADNFSVSAEKIEKAVTNKTKMIIINSPNNPSGAIIPVEELKKIAKVAVENEIFVISDEVYEKLIYIDKPNTSIGTLGEGIKAFTVTINSLSKSYCMTGWRVGYSGASVEVTKAMAAIHGHVTGNVNSMSQKAAALALNEFSNFTPMQEAYKNRRDYIVGRLNNMDGIHCNAPDGAFYVYPSVRGLIGKCFDNKMIKSSFDVAEFLIDQAHIACVPGEAFSMEGYVRFTFAIAPELIEKGMDRMEAALNKLK